MAHNVRDTLSLKVSGGKMALPKYPKPGAETASPADHPAPADTARATTASTSATNDADTTSTHTDVISEPGWRKWAMLAVLALGLSLIILDGTIVNVSLPTIIKALKLDLSQAQWVSALYTVVVASLLLGIGSFADRIGRRTTFAIGLVIFVLGSILAGSSTTGNALIFSRALQGVGAAFVMPSTLSNVHANFTGRDRAIAFGIWGSTISAMAAIGPLVGGALTTYSDWRWIFFINVPLGILCLIGAFVAVPNTKAAKEDSLSDVEEAIVESPKGEATFLPKAGAVTPKTGHDGLGFILSILSVGLIVFSIIEGPKLGWWHRNASLKVFNQDLIPNATLSSVPFLLIIGILILIGFVAWELYRVKHTKYVLFDPYLFRSPAFAWGNLTAMVVGIGQFSLTFLLPMFIINSMWKSPMTAGWVLAAMAIGAMISGGLARRVTESITPTGVVIIGLGLEVVGVAMLAGTLNVEQNLWSMAFMLVVYGVGLGFASAQLTSTVMGDVPVERSGMGSATQSTVRQLGSATGIALGGSVLATSLSNHLPDLVAQVGAPKQLTEPLVQATIDSGGANLRFMQLPPFSDILRLGYTDAVSTSMWVSMAFLVVGFLASLRLWQVKNRPSKAMLARQTRRHSGETVAERSAAVEQELKDKERKEAIKRAANRSPEGTSAAEAMKNFKRQRR